jgi:outer membrane protein assembly factor BamB
MDRAPSRFSLRTWTVAGLLASLLPFIPGHTQQPTKSARVQVARNGDGGPATRADVYPSGVAVDAHGNVYISENNMFDLDDTRVRRVGVDGIITTVAGTGTREFGGDKGPATRALLTGPVAIAADSAGTIYILDAEGVQDCNGLRLRRVSFGGIITTVAGGRSGFRRIGEDAGCKIFGDRIAIAPDGTVYIGDMADNRVLVLDPNGSLRVAAANLSGPLASNGRAIFVGVGNSVVVSLSGRTAKLVGDGSCGQKPDGSVGMCHSLHEIRGIALDKNNSIYVADSARVYRYNGAKSPTILIAGNGSEGFSGDGGPAVNATFRDIVGIAVDGSGNLYIADAENRRVRRVDANGIITSIAGNRPHNPPRPADP